MDNLFPVDPKINHPDSGKNRFKNFYNEQDFLPHTHKETNNNKEQFFQKTTKKKKIYSQTLKDLICLKNKNLVVLHAVRLCHKSICEVCTPRLEYVYAGTFTTSHLFITKHEQENIQGI